LADNYTRFFYSVIKDFKTQKLINANREFGQKKVEKKLSEMWNFPTKIMIYKTSDKFPSPSMFLDSM